MSYALYEFAFAVLTHLILETYSIIEENIMYKLCAILTSARLYTCKYTVAKNSK